MYYNNTFQQATFEKDKGENETSRNERHKRFLFLVFTRQKRNVNVYDVATASKNSNIYKKVFSFARIQIFLGGVETRTFTQAN